MSERVVDDVRIRAEGGVERVEELTARFRRATSKWDARSPDDLPQLSRDDEDAIANVTRLDDQHESVKALREAREAFETAQKRFVEQMGFAPTREQLPIRFAGNVWSLASISLASRLIGLGMFAAAGAAGTADLRVAAILGVPFLLFFFFGLRQRVTRTSLVISGTDLRLGDQRIPFDDLIKVDQEAGTHVVVKHRRGEVLITPDAGDLHVVWETLCAALREVGSS